jgi:hypothetical protein
MLKLVFKKYFNSRMMMMVTEQILSEEREIKNRLYEKKNKQAKCSQSKIVNKTDYFWS